MLCLPEIQSLLNRCVDNFPGIFRGLKDSDIHSAVYFTDGVATTAPKRCADVFGSCIVGEHSWKSCAYRDGQALPLCAPPACTLSHLTEPSLCLSIYPPTCPPARPPTYLCNLLHFPYFQNSESFIRARPCMPARPPRCLRSAATPGGMQQPVRARHTDSSLHGARRPQTLNNDRAERLGRGWNYH